MFSVRLKCMENVNLTCKVTDMTHLKWSEKLRGDRKVTQKEGREDVKVAMNDRWTWRKKTSVLESKGMKDRGVKRRKLKVGTEPDRRVCGGRGV